MSGQFVRLDYRNFEDAVEIADKRGDRIRPGDTLNMRSYINKKKMDTSTLIGLGMSRPNSTMTIISKGLMEGLYVSWPDDREVWLYVDADGPIEPLKVYGDQMEYDLVISYTFGIYEDQIIEKLTRELTDLGLRVYIIKEGERPNDPIWNVRFREALFYSYYFMPFLSEAYLKGSGTITELFDIARVTVHHRETDYFYPLLPLVEGWERLEMDSLNKRDEIVYQFDGEGFEWVRTHIFPLDLNWGIDKISRFILSLVNNYRKKNDYGFLREISDLIKYVEFIETQKNRKVRIYLKHPFLSSYYQFVLFDDGCQFVGFFEAGEQAKKVIRPQETIDEIEAYLDEEMVKSHDKTSDHTSQVIDISGSWLCMTCRYLGKPDLEIVEANPSIGLYENRSIYVCPKCNGTMIKQR